MDLTTYAVAQRYASQWEPPPKLFRAVGAWAASVYASHVLAIVESRIEGLGKPGEMRRGVEQLAEYRQNGFALIRGLKPKKSVRFKSPLGGRDFVVTREETGNWRHGDGKGNRIDWWPQGPVEDAIKWFTEWLDRQEKATQAEAQALGRRRAPSKDYVVDLQLLRRECLKYVSEPKLRANKVEGKVPIDISGWKYITDEKAAKQFVEEKFGDTVYVTIYFRRQHDAWEGQWSFLDRTISLDAPAGDRKVLPSLQQFRERMRSLLGTVWHETQHVGQDLLGGLKGVSKAGLPARELRQPGYTPSGLPETHKPQKGLGIPRAPKKIDHYLRDVEFFTNLGNDVRELRSYLDRVPPALRHDVFKHWVGVTTTPVPNFRGKSERMWRLRDEAHEKWKKLVAELWKAVADLT